MIESKIDRLKRQAEGRWAGIVTAIAPDLAHAVEKAGQHTGCPVHGGSDGFRVFKDFDRTGGGICNTCGPKTDGFALLQWATGLGMKDVLARVDEALNGCNPVPVYIPKPAAKKADGKRNTEQLRKAWVEAGKTPSIVKRAVIESYITGRGLPAGLAAKMAEVVRVHPSMPYWVKKGDKYEKLGEYVTLLSLVEKTVSGEALTIHRTFLEKGEHGWVKANVPDPKRIMPLKDGAEWESSAIRLGDTVGETLHIAEGIETSLAVMAMGKQHCWAAISSTNIAGFVPPEWVKRLVVWADKDASLAGKNAIEELRSRLAAGIELVVMMPSDKIPTGAKGIDWLDVYNARMSNYAARDERMKNRACA